jgi:hypothetical protein
MCVSAANAEKNALCSALKKGDLEGFNCPIREHQIDNHAALDCLELAEFPLNLQ